MMPFMLLKDVNYCALFAQPCLLELAEIAKHALSLCYDSLGLTSSILDKRFAVLSPIVVEFTRLTPGALSARQRRNRNVL